MWEFCLLINQVSAKRNVGNMLAGKLEKVNATGETRVVLAYEHDI